jgi:carboxyl-terminal processing protease
MKKRRELLWLSASTAALLMFSFTAGYGLRALYALARGNSATSLRAGAGLSGLRLLASRAGVSADPDMGPPQLYAEVLDRLQTLYVDKLPDKTLLSYSSIEQMLAALDDPNTRLLLPNEATALKDAEGGHFSGLGAVLTIKRFPSPDHQSVERDLTVVTTMPGSPAEAAHLMPGDRITEVDGHWIAPAHLWAREMRFFTDHYNRADSQWGRDADSQADPDAGSKRPGVTPAQRKEAEDAADKLAARWRASTDMQAALELLMTATTGDHTVTVERSGEAKPHQVKVTFGTVQVAPVPKPRILPGNIGLLQIRQLSPEAVTAAAAGLKELHDGGAQTLVLDLRHSPGGSLEAAQEIAGLFLPSGPMGVLQVRDDHRKMVDKPLPVKPAATAPPKFSSIAVLVDGGTAGSSEELAAALRDHGVAKLFGSTTFGDGTEQTIMPLDNGAAVCVTSAHFLTPKHVDFDGKGLKPDVAIPASPGLDRQLEQAVKSLRA